MRTACWAVLGCVCSTASWAQAGAERAEKLAQTSVTAKQSLALIQRLAQSLEDPTLKAATVELVANPAPTFMARLQAPAAREGVRAALADAGFLEAKVSSAELFPPLADPLKAPQSFLAAPGQALQGHHSYPGGLAEHTAFNVQVALGLGNTYQAVYGYQPKRDYLVAAPILHDVMKPWCLQWGADGSLTAQARIAATAAHHIFAIAEALHRGLAPDFIVVLASAHESPLGDSAARVVDFIRAAALLAGVDPAAGGVVKNGQGAFGFAKPPSIEAVANNLSDHDYVLTEPAVKVTDAALDRLARSAAGKKPLTDADLRWIRHRAQASLPGVKLYALWRERGDAGVREELARLHVPLVPAPVLATPQK